MTNEVEIVVVTRDKTDFNAIRAKSKAAGGDIGKDIGKSVEGGLEDVVKKVGPQGAKAGLNFGSSMAGQLESTLSSTGPAGAAVTGALASIAVAAAPFLGALLSGAVIGGAAGGGILGGLLLVKDDPRVKSAAASAGSTIMNDLKVDAKGFVQPAIEGISIIQKAFAESNSSIASLLSKASTFVTPLARAVGSVIPQIAGGLNDLVQGAGPVIDALADGIKGIGSAIAGGFHLLSEDGASAATAISAAFMILIGTIKATFVAVDALAKSFGWLAQHGVFGPGVEAEFDRFSSDTAGARDAIDSVGDSITGMGDDADASASQLRDLSDALKAQYDPAFALIDAQNQLSKAQDDYNKSVAKNGASSDDAQRKLSAVAEAALSLTDATATASGTFDGQLTPAMEQVLRTAGLSERQIGDLRKQFQSAEKQAGRTAGSLAFTASEAKALAAAVKGAGAQLAALHSKTVDLNIRVNTSYYGKPFSTSGATGIGGGNFTGHAAGGVVGAAANGGPQSNMTLVGEQGPEFVNLPVGSSVTPASQTRQQLADMSGGSGRIQVELVVSGSDQGMLQWLHQKQRSKELQIFATSIV